MLLYDNTLLHFIFCVQDYIGEYITACQAQLEVKTAKTSVQEAHLTTLGDYISSRKLQYLIQRNVVIAASLAGQWKKQTCVFQCDCCFCMADIRMVPFCQKFYCHKIHVFNLMALLLGFVFF